METLATPTSPLLIGIAEDETAFEFFLDEIHLGADQKHHGLRVDEYFESATAAFSLLTFIFNGRKLDHFVKWSYCVGIFDGVGKPRATARADADLDAGRGFAALVEQLVDAAQSRVGYGDEWCHRYLFVILRDGTSAQDLPQLHEILCSHFVRHRMTEGKP